MKRYQKEGNEKTTRQLIAAISLSGIDGMTLLDIGGGLGGIQHAMLENGLERATYVDASSAYVQAAKGEATRRTVDRGGPYGKKIIALCEKKHSKMGGWE